jgi:hypothetical protein
MYYKDPNNEVHFLEDVNFKHLLPENSVPITKEEAEILSNNAPSKTPIARAAPMAIQLPVAKITNTSNIVPINSTKYFSIYIYYNLYLL